MNITEVIQRHPLILAVIMSATSRTEEESIDRVVHEAEAIQQTMDLLKRFEPHKRLHPANTYWWKHVVEVNIPKGYISEAALLVALVESGFRIQRANYPDCVWVRTNLPKAAEELRLSRWKDVNAKLLK